MNRTYYHYCPGFIEAFRAKLNETGISVVRVAKLLDIDRKTIYRWLSGASEPRIGEIRILADILNCSVLDLIGGTGGEEIDQHRDGLE